VVRYVSNLARMSVTDEPFTHIYLRNNDGSSENFIWWEELSHDELIYNIECIGEERGWPELIHPLFIRIQNCEGELYEYQYPVYDYECECDCEEEFDYR